jgi:hypothetical protein
MLTGRPRIRVHVNVGNLLETAGAALGCYAIAALAGAAAGMLAGGVLLVVAAELIYDARIATVALPHRPRPLTAARRAVRPVMLRISAAIARHRRL